MKLGIYIFFFHIVLKKEKDLFYYDKVIPSFQPSLNARLINTSSYI